MKILRPGRLVEWTALSLTGAALTTAAHAQSALFNYEGVDVTNGQKVTHQYGLLNGDFISLYLNDRGDLGAPYDASGNKPGGILDGFVPAVQDNGDVKPGMGTYGALFSFESTQGAGNGSIGASVRAKHEYISVGSQEASEGFAIVGNDNKLNQNGKWLPDTKLSVVPNSFAVSGNSITGGLSATSQLTTPTSSGNLQITQQIALQEAGEPKNRVKFTVTFKNNGTQTLDGLRYARAVDPNQGYLYSLSTFQHFRTPGDPNAFAIDSWDTPGALNPQRMALGVSPGDAGTDGTTIFATNFLSETSLLSNLQAKDVRKNNRLVLHGKGADYLAAGSDTVFASTNDFTDGSLDTTSFTPGDAALVLLSPSYSLAPGDEQTFIYYLFFSAVSSTPPADVPEPGPVAFYAGGIAGAGLLLRRRRTR